MKGISPSAVAFLAIASSVFAENTFPPKPTWANVNHPDCQRNTCPAVDSKWCTVHLPHRICTKFYKCDAGAKIEMDCPIMNEARQTRLHFNPKKQVCDWPALAGCTGDDGYEPVTDSGEEVLKPHEWDCTRYYRITTTGQKKKEKCSKGFHFSEKAQGCVWPMYSECKWKCPPAGSNDIALLPHDCRCDRYYKCESGTPIWSRCPPGYHFNVDIGGCDTIANAGCTLEGAEPTPNRCTMSGTYRLPHESNCNYYYQCNNGAETMVQCSIGLHFNPKKLICELPEDAKCDPNATPRPTTTTTTTTTTTQRPTPKPRPTVCPPKGSTEKVRLAHNCYCIKYYECVNGVPVLTECPYGKHFEYKTQQCMSPAQAQCFRPIVDNFWEPVTQPTVALAPEMDDCPAKGMGFLPHECSCSKYYVCKDGVRALTQCPAGQLYDHVKEECRDKNLVNCIRTNARTSWKPKVKAQDARSLSENQSCVGTCPDVDPVDHTVILPNEDCGKYCSCSNGTPYVMSCPDGLHFSKELKVCVLPKQAKCESSTYENLKETQRQKSAWWAIPFFGNVI